MESSKVRIYACGGTAINIVSVFESMGSDAATLKMYAEPEICYIDTSESNVKVPCVASEQLYLVDGCDGSGKDRAKNAARIKEILPEFLHQFKPDDFNIIVHSTSGGSGSVCGPLIYNELISRGKEVIVITVGTTDSKKELTNTVNTLKGYEHAASSQDHPVLMAYFENDVHGTMAQVDSEVISTIIKLLIVFSGNNHGLDSEDIKNFVNYERVTDFEPSLTLLKVFVKEVSCERNQAVVSLITLTNDTVPTTPGILVEYQATGKLPMIADENISSKLPIHYAAVSGYFYDVITGMEKKLHQFNEVRSAVVHKRVKVSSNEANDHGLIL